MGPISPKAAIAHISKLLVLSYIIDWIFIAYVSATCNFAVKASYLTK
jgi:hypothetical protein